MKDNELIQSSLFEFQPSKSDVANAHRAKLRGEPAPTDGANEMFRFSEKGWVVNDMLEKGAR